MKMAKERGHINEIEEHVLEEWYDKLIQSFDIKVDMIIYLETPPHVAMERILQRGRAGEAKLHLNDMFEMERMYQCWLNNASCPVIKIRASTRAEMEMEVRNLEEYIINHFGYTY
jgi:deoxyadenosine/deoxycytidine kinase